MVEPANRHSLTRPASLTSGFNGLSGGRDFIKGPFEAAAPQAENPDVSLLDSLSNKTLVIEPVYATKVPVDPSKPNAELAAQEQQDAAAGANKINEGRIAAAEDVLRQAQGEIIAAARAARVEGALPSAGSDMTGAELLVASMDGGAASIAAAAFGKGSLATKGASAFDGAATFQEMTSGGMTAEDAKAAISDVLVQSSLSAQGHSMDSGFGTLQAADAAETIPTQFNWAQIIEDHGPDVIDDILSFQPGKLGAIQEMNDLYTAVSANEAYEDHMKDMEELAGRPEYAGVAAGAEQDAVDRQQVVRASLSDAEVVGIRSDGGALDTRDAGALLVAKYGPKDDEPATAADLEDELKRDTVNLGTGATF